MAGTGFGLPKGLLNNSTQIPPRSSPVLPIPPPPSFGDIKFQSIGRPPRLLERFSDPTVAQGSERDRDMLTTTDHEEQQQNMEQNAIPRNRPSLSQALAERNSTGPAAIDNVTRQGSTVPSHSPLTDSNSTASSMRIPNHPFRVSTINSAQRDPPPSVPKFMSSSVDSNFSLAKSPSNTGEQSFDGNLESMQLSYPSASPGPNAITDHVMEDVQPTRVPDHPSLQPITRKYEGLRQIQAHLRSSILNASSPNLASVALLTDSACQKANALHADARQLRNSSQEVLTAAQNSFAAVQALFKVADEVKGLAEGAKAELDRLSSNQQRSINNEIRELFQTMDNWISNQEADEAALRARRVEQLKLRKQKAELARASTQHTATSPSSVSPMSSSAAAVQAQAPILLAPAPARQRLFLSSTPEVDIKVDPQTWIAPPSQTVPVPSLPPAAADLARRQEDLRKKLKEKRSSAEAESRSASPSDANRIEQQQLEEERKLEEQRQKEALARQSAGEKAREEEEQKARGKAQKEKEEDERKARERAEVEEAQKAAELQKAREVMEAQRKARAETKRKVQEAAEVAKRKAEAEEQEKKRQQAEAEGEKQRMAAFLAHQKQEREKQAKLAEEAKQRALQEEKEREQRLLEEQARMKVEREKEEKLRREQELQRQRIQADRSKALADRAQEIRAQRESRRPLDVTSEMNVDISPGTPTATLNPTRDPRIRPPAPPNPPANKPPPSPLETQLPPIPGQSSTSRPFSSEVRDISNTTSPNQVATSSQATYSSTPHPPIAPLTPVRNPSLPPVAHLSPAGSPPLLPKPRPPPQPTWSIHRLSGDGGNVPYRENPDLSPQAQAANLRHVANALHLPLNLSQPVRPDQPHTSMEALHVKTEPTQDDSSFLQVPGQSSTNEIVPVRAPQVHQRSESQSMTSQQAFPPSQAGQSLSARPLGSHTDIVPDQPMPSSSSPVTDVAVNVHHQQQQQVSQLPNQSRLSGQLPPGPNPQIDHFESQRQPPQLVLPLTDQRSRSRSPFRMGPDEYDSQLIVRTPSDTHSDNYAPPPPVYYGRPEPHISPPAHWDHYSPDPPSLPRNSNTYRPNYANRTRSPVAGRKRSRDYSPPPHTPIIRDYREYDDHRPRRYSRSPPPRRSRPASRSPSPSYTSRLPLASRLTQGTGGGYSYRPPSPRELKSSRPELLDRFTDAQPPPNAPTRPGRGRGKRGRGGPPPSGLNHASLEQRISGAKLINRLEDPDPPRRL